MSDCNITKNPRVCAWIQTFSQVAVAVVVVYAGVVVNQHMEVWSESFKRGADDIHTMQENITFISEGMISIDQSMNTIAYSMSSIDSDMEDIKMQMLEMNKGINTMNTNVNGLGQEMNYMNSNVRGVGTQMTPQGFLGSMMPF
jgi:uncharacterized phage infection (PIP) family protein YhgE